MLSRDAIRQFASAGQALALYFVHGVVAFDAEVVAELGQRATAANITISLEPIGIENMSLAQQNALDGDYDMYRLVVLFGSQAITGFEEMLTVMLPFDGDTPIVVWHIDDDGLRTPVASYFDADNHLVTFVTGMTGVFVIGTDVSDERMQEPDAILRFIIGEYQYDYRGEMRISDTAPFIVGERTMVPLRIIAEAMGATVSWNGRTRTVTIVLDDVVLELPIDVPLPGGMGTPVIINGRTLVPLRYLIETLGAEVRWDRENAAVYVYPK